MTWPGRAAILGGMGDARPMPWARPYLPLVAAVAVAGLLLSGRPLAGEPVAALPGAAPSRAPRPRAGMP